MKKKLDITKTREVRTRSEDLWAPFRHSRETLKPHSDCMFNFKIIQPPEGAVHSSPKTPFTVIEFLLKKPAVEAPLEKSSEQTPPNYGYREARDTLFVAPPIPEKNLEEKPSEPTKCCKSSLNYILG